MQGVTVGGVELAAGQASLIVLGVALALVAGKPLGIVGIAWLMVRAGWSRLPAGMSWSGVWLIGLLAGIGFTMSIFIAMLAFADENLLGAAKLGVLLGSLGAALLGLGWGVGHVRRAQTQHDCAALRSAAQSRAARGRARKRRGSRDIGGAYDDRYLGRKYITVASSILTGAR